MAKIKVESQSTGTGIYTLKTGAASTNYSATLPDSTGTLLMADGDGSSLTGITHTPADNSVTLAKMAHGTDGELITYDAAGAPANVAVGTSGHILTSGGAGVAPTFQAAAGGGDLTPAFSAYRSTNQAILDAVYTTVAFANEDFDTDGCYDTSTYKFTPTTAGKYWISSTCFLTDCVDAQIYVIEIYKNGTTGVGRVVSHSSRAESLSMSVSAIVDFNGSSDYVQIRVKHWMGNGKQLETNRTMFSGFLLQGV